MHVALGCQAGETGPSETGADEGTTSAMPPIGTTSGSSDASPAGSSGDDTGTTDASTSGDEPSTTTDSGETDTQDLDPQYEPFFLADCEDGRPGERAVGPDALESVVGQTDPKVVYATERAVDGLGQSCRTWSLAGQNFFGGRYLTLDQEIGAGDDVWMRHALFFPDGFCFGFGTTPGDGWGATKWMRIEFDNGGPQGAPGDRLTLQLGNMGAQACSGQTEVYGATREYAGAANLRPDNPTPITTGAWHMVQWQVHLAADETGFVRFWVDDVFQGQVDAVTMSDAGNAIDFITYGDYWNGSPHEDIEWYLDEVIMTTQTPTTTDAEGRPYISPETRVADFRAN